MRSEQVLIEEVNNRVMSHMFFPKQKRNLIITIEFLQEQTVLD